MISDLQAVLAVNDLYNVPDAPWDALWDEAANDGVCCALRRVDDDDLVVLRGSETAEDWARDFFAIPHEIAAHPQLGDVHAGFAMGMDDTLAKLLPRLRENVTVTGHSLGAARASILCGLLCAIGRPPRARIVFGEPRPGCERLRSLIVAAVPRSVSYRNAGVAGHDLVTDVPTDPPFLHPTALVDVCAPPPADDEWGPFAWHHIQLYMRAIEARSAA